MNLGPRVIFKDDRDSASGRGCRMFAAHFTHYVMAILIHGVQAFSLDKTVKVIRLTEGHRHIRDTRDLHEECRAFDFTAEMEEGTRIPRAAYERVGHQMRKWLGSDYDVIVHGEGTNLHIHAEYDPKPQRSVA